LIPIESLRIIEFFLTVFVVLVAFGVPHNGGAAFRMLDSWTGRLAARRCLCVFLIGLAAPLIRCSILLWKPIPQPAVHDEFSHLLAADTFASRRLTNPTHPMWMHFETFHVNQQPSYMSMYPPGQGAVLAFGRAVFGHPWFGVCVSMGLMCAAVCWMLYGWLPAEWALLGGVLLVVRIGVSSYWMNSFWGGALPAIGGAVVLGALPRLMRRPRVRTTLLLGCGLIILANTRPYEGFLLSIPVAATLLAWIIRKRRNLRFLGLRVVLPLSVLLLAAAGAMGYYNWRVFGGPLKLPYQVNRATYAVAPVFIWQSPQPEPRYRHEVMRDFYLQWELPVFKNAKTVAGFLASAATKGGLALAFFLGPLLTVPLAMLPRVFRDRRWRFFAWTAGVFVIGLSLNVFSVPHYLAPATALIYALLLESMRHLRSWRYRDQAVGLFLVLALPLLCGVMLVLEIGRYTPAQDLPRNRVQKILETLPGGQLAIVRYAPGHDPMGEWVYNAANIDDAKVVWAREMTPALDQQLIKYFKDRQVWLVEPDCTPPRVSKYAVRSALERKAL
jgi:hypothetical protein